MKPVRILSLIGLAVLCGCGGAKEQPSSPPAGPPAKRHIITRHIGMFLDYDPPWVDHSSWMSDEAKATQDKAARAMDKE